MILPHLCFCYIGKRRLNLLSSNPLSLKKQKNKQKTKNKKKSLKIHMGTGKEGGKKERQTDSINLPLLSAMKKKKNKKITIRKNLNQKRNPTPFHYLSQWPYNNPLEEGHH